MAGLHAEGQGQRFLSIVTAPMRQKRRSIRYRALYGDVSVEAGGRSALVSVLDPSAGRALLERIVAEAAR
jgi:hypothetical protein